MDMPPTRYRIVERNRRLVVIDRSDETDVDRPQSPSRASDDRATNSDPFARVIALVLAGGARTEEGYPIIQTGAFIDDNAPRLIIINPPAQRRIAYSALMLVGVGAAAAVVTVEEPGALFGLMALFSEGARAWIRRYTTRWLDDLQAASERSEG